MRIQRLTIENSRAIRRFHIEDLKDAIVIAGPNGCGKSTVFDALRLIKSAYGQYHPNEYRTLFSEFDIDFNNLQTDSGRIFHDPNSKLEIRADFELANAEIEYLKAHAREIYLNLRWSLFLRRRAVEGDNQIADPSIKKADGEIVESQARVLAETLLSVLDKVIHTAHLIMEPNGAPIIVGSPVLELMFSVYKPGSLGVIDYQAPSRTYARDNLGNISLQIRDTANQRAQHALVNVQSKYTGVKTEMAQSYVAELLAQRAGAEVPQGTTLKETLDELFANFFPGKTFLGAIPTLEGGLSFPVRLESGREHDINDLSSGEKEVLLGYLRLRNSGPRNSIILLDEPELHLNPRLSRALPRFYEKHLSRALNNQIWLVTHSDAILREAVREPTYSVYHMQDSARIQDGYNQTDLVTANADIENALIDLSGDLAAFDPRSKVVLLEGEGSETDARIIAQLFPEFAERVNLVSLGPKRAVQNAHAILEKAAMDGRLDARFYSIVDRDFSGTKLAPPERQFSWDVYHIENYLLNPRFIREALLSITAGETDLGELEIHQHLKTAARDTTDDIVRILMTEEINNTLVTAISLKYDNIKQGPVDGLSDAIERSKDKVASLARGALAKDRLGELEASHRTKLEGSLENGSWTNEFRGRNILKRFVDSQNGVVNYEQLRNLIVSRMKEANYRPEGMQKVIDAISAK